MLDPAVIASVVTDAALITSAYDAYGVLSDKTVVNPHVSLPLGYTLVAWITMDDFLLKPGSPSNRRFYGFIARDTGDDYVLAIRGTEGILEWWDDFHVLLVPFKNLTQFGNVAQGFVRIYETLDSVMVASDGRFFAPHEIDPKLTAASTFAEKVAAIVRHDARIRPRYATAKPPAVAVTGHSLGAALATLFVAENATTDAMPVKAFTTFASPRVGDQSFADTFGALAYDGAPLQGRRVFNRPDLVPNVPLAIEGFVHVGKPIEVESRASDAVKWTFPCFHDLASYALCLGAPAPAGWSCDASDLDAVLAEARRLAREALGIVPGETLLTY